MIGHSECFDGMASSSIGKPIRVNFTKGSKKMFIFGNFFTKDPESGSIVLVQQSTAGPSDEGKCSQCFIVIPGSSVRSVQLLCDEGNREAIGKLTEAEGFDGTVMDSAELRDGLDKMIGLNDETAVQNHGKRILSVELTEVEGFDGAVKDSAELRDGLNKMIGLNDQTAVQNHGKRTLSETVRIFNEFTLSRRQRLIDALNKNRIKFSEKPHVLAPTVEEEVALEGAASTIIALEGGMKIYPPYGKSDVIGGGSLTAKEVLHKLSAENVFED